ncbi:MAG TPA: PspA/IM30 family protein [Eubacteriales bacterium]|nr:PspA/IM30 family protein [Clostridia bacterium]HRV73092.1 PspA/IM30 family protein [Eubacteriales bacterium]
MASILARFSEIIKSNINAMLDKIEDPSKMVDQYLTDLTEDLAEVRKETAGIIAEETRTRRMVDDNAADVARYNDLAKRALRAGNESDARVFIAKKQELEAVGASLNTAYVAAHENAEKMRQMHDKLTRDIQSLQTRKSAIKAKVAVAKTQTKINNMTSSMGSAQGNIDAFDRMEARADQMLDTANAMTELNSKPIDEARALEEKYSSADTSSVDDELKALKAELGV